MTTLDWRMRDVLPQLGEKGRLTVLIDLLLRADQMRLRCYPSVKKIAKDTGQSTSVVDAALDWLVSAKAIIKIGYRQRIGAKEKALPTRQTVYQLTGTLCIDGKAYPYLYFNPETRSVVDELIRLSQSHISESEISHSEILDNEISDSETEGITSIKGTTKKKDKPTVAKPRHTDLIKAWLDTQNSKNAGAYKNVEIQASAKELWDSGVTVEDMTAFTRVKKSQEFWQDKFVGFDHIANEILAWKAKQKPRNAAPAAPLAPVAAPDMTAKVIPMYDPQWRKENGYD
jgi:hypothetical protein